MILIAGGAGYIGAHANKRLAAKGCETVVYDNLSQGYREFARWGHFVEGDLADRESLRRCFQTYPIEAVLHYGAMIEVGESVKRPSAFYRNNVVNTLNLLDVMVEHDVKQFIFSSSCAVYEPSSSLPMAEDQRLRPATAYGKSKFMVEQILEDYEKAYGIRFVCLRYFNAAGADPSGEIGEWHHPETHLIPIVLQAAAGRRDDFSIYGTDYNTPDGTCIRDYVHVNDLADAHILALEYLKQGGGSDIFNLGNTTGYSVRDVINAAERVTGKSIRVTLQARRLGDAQVLIGNAEKARKILGWQPQYTDLESIIRTAWKWHNRKG